MKRRWLALFAVMVCIMGSLAAAIPAYADSGTLRTNMPTGQKMFITLVGHNDRRWNANDTAIKSNVIHLDNAGGSNRSFRLDDMGDGWYAIKHIKSGGTDYFVDVDNKSTSAGAVLHLWESNDGNIRNKHNGHFAFYYQYTDEYGNDVFAIKNRNSGLWIGCEDGRTSEGTKIIQTTEDRRSLWYVTPSTYPLEYADQLTGQYDHALMQIFDPGTDDCMNKKDDLNESLTFFNLGTTNKWRLEYVPQYQAYRVAYATGGETMEGRCWDLKGESGRVGTTINVWSTQSLDGNSNTSQLWRVRKVGKNYLFQNACSGLYLHKRSDGSIVTDPESTPCEFSIIDARYDNPSYRINYSEANPWMRDIPDDALLSSVNIPGSHDAGTADVFGDVAKSLSISSCQFLYYQEQLNVGARSFDIRCDAGGEGTTAKDVRIIHGFSLAKCCNRDGSPLTLGNIFDASTRFLETHPTETIILTIKPDSGSTRGLEDAVETFVRNNKSRVYCGGGIPTMGEARGKIVIMRRFPRTRPTNDAELERGMGIDLSNWDDFNYRNYHAFANIYDRDGTKVYVQDCYDVSGQDKWGYIADGMRQTAGGQVRGDSWVFNYTSCANGDLVPLANTRDIQYRIFDDEANCIDNRFLGQVMLNFVDEPMCRLIYETNLAEGRTFSYRASQADEGAGDSDSSTDRQARVLFRLYNPYSGEHLFTTNPSEYAALARLGWRQEGRAWRSPRSSDRPVYRLYNPYSGDHLYTASASEYAQLGAIGWNQEGVSFYSASEGVAIYRLFNPYETVGTHLFTISPAEYDNLCRIGWRGEGTAFFGAS